MPTKPIDRLIFAQGGLCFFCRKPLPKNEASVEHLLASANGGSNSDENCVACCKAINALFGSMSLKEKIQVVLNQKGQFKCPSGVERSTASNPISKAPDPQAPKSPTDKLSLIIADLKKRGIAKPGTVKTLTSTISALFQKKLEEKELTSLLTQMQTKGWVVVNGTKVSYALPTKDF